MAAQQLRAQTLQSPGFALLSKADQQRLASVTDGTNPLSKKARQMLAGVANADFQTMDADLQKMLLEQVLMLQAWTPIKHVNVNPQPNPADAFWAQQYDDKNFHSYMTAGADGVVNIYPVNNKSPQEIMNSSLVHETGHIMSQQRWGVDEKAPRWADWRLAVRLDGINPSTYAENSPGEDFSEALVIYQRVRGTPYEAEFRAMMPERFLILDGMV